MASKKEKMMTFLKGIETGDPAAAAVVNEKIYIQHNPYTGDQNEGLAKLLKRISKTSPRVKVARIFEDDDFTFAHTEYDFSNVKIGFEVFRFEEGQAVEHWDNLQPIQAPNPSGRSMIDGSTEITDFDKTEANRTLVRSFVDDILIHRHLEKLGDYVSNENYVQHNPEIADGSQALCVALSEKSDGEFKIKYDKSHRFLAEGNFVLSVNEGFLNGIHSSFYDLFRIDEGKLVEHWNTIETVPPRSEWKNENGKF